ncbi:aldo/keto reductase [Marisediminicola senii]|uniref:aldo/keto reductase n=1 Tax=Marisediminicola senii TaxID=2711233 RepID=UPI0013EAD431|nr:aldo/keto reductase [Marisediminicola senii]
MRYRRIGSTRVSAIGLGTLGLTAEGGPDRPQAITTIRAAVESGITLIDTADAYGDGACELLVAEALGSNADDVLVATKGGIAYLPGGGWEHRGSPAQLRAAATDSARRLGVDAVGLFQFHHPDPAVPFDESVGALLELLDEGVIRLAGVCNVTLEQMQTAHRILGRRLSSVQNRLSPRERGSEPQLDLTADHDIAFLAWSPLGGARRAASLGADNPEFARVARELGVSVHRTTLAWELAMQHTVIPLVGATRRTSIRDSALAADLVLTSGQLDRLGA